MLRRSALRSISLAAASLFALPLIHRDKLLGVVAGAAHSRLSERERGWLHQGRR